MGRVRSRRAFTLIELLIVVAIIAILASILFPVFARARANARRASCQSNLKQIGLGILQYTQDYDEKYPNVEVRTPHQGLATSRPYGWAEAIQPYVKSTQILQCPDDLVSFNEDPRSSNVNNTPTEMHGDWAGLGAYTDYGMNTNLTQDGNPSSTKNGIGDGKYGLLVTAVMYPSNTLLAGDDTTYGAGNAMGGTLTAAFTTSSPARTRHLEGANYAFCDGHVKWLRREALNGYDKPASSSAFGVWIDERSVDCRKDPANC